MNNNRSIYEGHFKSALDRISVKRLLYMLRQYHPEEQYERAHEWCRSGMFGDLQQDLIAYRAERNE